MLKHAGRWPLYGLLLSAKRTLLSDLLLKKKKTNNNNWSFIK